MKTNSSPCHFTVARRARHSSRAAVVFAAVALLLSLMFPDSARAAEPYDITSVGTWYSILSVPTYVILGCTAVFAAGIATVCFLVDGMARSAICMVMSVVFLGTIDFQSFVTPVMRYQQNYTKLMIQPDNVTILWALANVMIGLFALLFVLTVIRSWTERRCQSHS